MTPFFIDEGKVGRLKEEVMEQKIDTETSHPGERTFTEILKMNAKKLATHNCKGCAKREDTVGRVAALGGKAAVGLGAGVCVGVGVLAVAAVAEVAVPAILLFKAFALTGGALGLVKGVKEFKK
jgi:hypothetical protein